MTQPQPHPPAPPAVHSVQVGRIAPLGPQAVPSGFVKRPVSGPVCVGTLTIDGDEQADLTVHGGKDKAVYCYPLEHYAAWVADAPRHQPTLTPGAFGENLTTTGLTETSVTIGDVFRIGTALVQVTQPRQPCFKLSLRFADPSLGRIMMQTGRTGWYLRVLEPGELRAGDAIVRIGAPAPPAPAAHPASIPAWTIARFNQFLLTGREDRALLTELASLEGLADEWRERARAKLGE